MENEKEIQDLERKKKTTNDIDIVTTSNGVKDSDKEMMDLNRKFRKKDSSTNVLSFTNNDISKSMTGNLGDIAINHDFVERESIEQGKTYDDHIIHMLIHGIYHILGLDHENDKMAEIMEKKEVALLNKLNIRNPYN